MLMNPRPIAFLPTVLISYSIKEFKLKLVTPEAKGLLLQWKKQKHTMGEIKYKGRTLINP